MEGPSLFLASEQLQPFIGKRVLEVRGNTKVDKDRCAGQEVLAVFSHGKQLLIQFDAFALRIHFMLFGTYEADVNGRQVTGDYVRARVPRMALRFNNGELRLFNCSVRYLEGSSVRREFDFGIDVLAPAWDASRALKALSSRGKEQIGDVLLDQEVFAGVGKIVKNDVLSLVRIRTAALVGRLSVAKRREIVREARAFSLQFLRWRREFRLRRNLRVHQKGECPYCGGKLVHGKMGHRQRMAHYCPRCQRKTAR